MTKVVLIRPPCLSSLTAVSGGLLTPPLALAYLAGSLRNNGHEVSTIDAIGLNPEKKTHVKNNSYLFGISFSEILKLIPEDVDLIGFSGMFSFEWTAIRPLVNMIGKKFSNKYFIAGGEHFSAVPEVCLEQCKNLDAVVLGEGEETIAEIAIAIDTSSSWSNIDGLVLRNDDKFVKTGKRKRLTKLNEIPKPAWDLTPINNYLDLRLSFGVDRGRTMPMLASRGCPFQCTFCSSPDMWGTTWIARDVKLLCDEIEEYIQKYKIDAIDFYDLTAIVKKSWIIEFCNELISRNLNITWQLPSGTRSEAIDDEVTPLLYKSGCRNMVYSPESGSERTLVAIKKKVKLERMKKSFQSSIKAGLNTKINVMIGLPEETHKDILMTLWFLVKMSFIGVQDVSIGIFAPYPGSEIYDDLVKKGRIKHDEDYWKKLAYVDLAFTESYCENASSKNLLFYNWLGYFLFYASNYTFRPIRIYKTLRNLIVNNHESKGEKALSQFFKRIPHKFKISKKTI